MTLTSLVIPTYNRATRLSRALQSALEPDIDLEVIVVDDRSTDSTQALVLEWAQRDPRVRYFRNEFAQGAGGARNFGLTKAHGQMIAFLDSDDEFSPDHLRRSTALLGRESEIDIVFANKLLCEEDSQEQTDFFRATEALDGLSLTDLGQDWHRIDSGLMESLIRGNPIPIQTVVLRRELALKLEFDNDVAPAEDRDYCFRAALQGGTFALSTRPGAKVYRHDDNISRNCDRVALRYASVHRVLFERYAKELPGSSPLQAVLRKEIAHRRRLVPYHLRQLERHSEAVSAALSNLSRPTPTRVLDFLKCSLSWMRSLTSRSPKSQ